MTCRPNGLLWGHQRGNKGLGITTVDGEITVHVRAADIAAGEGAGVQQCINEMRHVSQVD